MQSSTSSFPTCISGLPCDIKNAFCLAVPCLVPVEAGAGLCTKLANLQIYLTALYALYRTAKNYTYFLWSTLLYSELHYTTLLYIIYHYFTLHYRTMHYFALHNNTTLYTAQQHTSMHCHTPALNKLINPENHLATLFWTTLNCSALDKATQLYTAQKLHHSALYHTSIPCSLPDHTPLNNSAIFLTLWPPKASNRRIIGKMNIPVWSVMQFIAGQCNIVQISALQCLKV